jgi:dTDP-L-rhamnose 4-epimerase
MQVINHKRITMKGNVLITGGAGFIGSHLADELIREGYTVRVLDNLSEQVHGQGKKRPDYLNEKAELVIGDIRDSEAVSAALDNIDIVYHFAAMVGVGQSMYAINEYTDVNNRGTAVLMEALIERPVKKLVVASSMSIYGEGLYKSPNGRLLEGKERMIEQLKVRDWELYNKKVAKLTPVPTPESKSPALASVYALSKYDQEKMCLIAGQAYNIPTVALRFFNVYGTRQSLSNPYTGVLAIFASRLLNNNPPLIFEDGNQRRDFVHVKDVARACRLAAETPGAAFKSFNIGSGESISIAEIACRLTEILGKQEIISEITGQYRTGDIRHCFADISLAKKVLGYRPQITFEEGMTELAEWLKTQQAEDKVSRAGEELNIRGLLV